MYKLYIQVIQVKKQCLFVQCPVFVLANWLKLEFLSLLKSLSAV